MTIYEMNKEQIIETAKKIAVDTGCELLGLWADLTHAYRRTIILVDSDFGDKYSDKAYEVFNGLKDSDGNTIIESHELYGSGYESCELDVTDNRNYYSKILKTCKGVNWLG